jgi:hypothetical protein
MTLDLVAVLVIFLVPVDWIIVAIQDAIRREEPSNMALRYRTWAGIGLSVLATAAGVFAMARLSRVKLDPTMSVDIVVLMLLGPSLIQVGWGLLYLFRRFQP